MALKALRNEKDTDISFYLNQVTTAGRIVTYVTSTTGLGDMDDANTYVQVPSNSGGVPVGVLMNDVVDVDLSRYALNMHKDEVQKNSKVCIMRKGMIRTNCLKAGDNPVPGSGAYFTSSGNFTVTADSLQVGRFDSGKDADGYVRVEVNLP